MSVFLYIELPNSLRSSVSIAFGLKMMTRLVDGSDVNMENNCVIDLILFYKLQGEELLICLGIILDLIVNSCLK